MGSRRLYPRAKIGDVFGNREVTALLPPRPGDSNERVRARCLTCGHEAPVLVFNLRAYDNRARLAGTATKRAPRCKHCPKASPAVTKLRASVKDDREKRYAANAWRGTR